MQSFRVMRFLQNASAIMLGLCIPSIAFGRAYIGVFLGLSFISVLLSYNNKFQWQEFRTLLSSRVILVLGIIFITTALNIPFSIRPDLALIAWSRTWFYLISIAYLIFCLRDRIVLVAQAMSFGMLSIFIFEILDVLAISKYVLNCVLFCIPVSFYYSYIKKDRALAFVNALTLLLFVNSVFQHTSKAALLGGVLIFVTTLFVYGLRQDLKKKTFFIGVFIICLIGIGLTYWLPTQLHTSSAENADKAFFPIWLVDFHRQLIWEFSYDLFQESPWVGFGLNASNYHPLTRLSLEEYFQIDLSNLKSFAQASVYPGHPHNWLIEIFVDAGLIGAIPLISGVLLLFYHAIKKYRMIKSHALLAFIGLNAAFWGTGLVNFSFWTSVWQLPYFVASGICLIALLNEQTNEN